MDLAILVIFVLAYYLVILVPEQAKLIALVAIILTLLVAIGGGLAVTWKL